MQQRSVLAVQAGVVATMGIRAAGVLGREKTVRHRADAKAMLEVEA